MASIDTDISSASSNIISSTQDSTYQNPTQLRYQSSDQSNSGFNECSNGQQFFEQSVQVMPNSSTSSSSSSSTTGPVVQSHNTRTLRPHSTPATLIWLEDNYELAEGVCIPRSVLYLHYVDFCANNSVQPVNAASFGKIIRQQFPQLTTRRLGTRGQSRYHYYGIAIRESSAYYQMSYSKKSGQNNVDPLKREARENISKQPLPPVINSRSRSAAMLPQFPNLKDMILPNNLDRDKISTFQMMYRTHCQRILDTIIRANFDEVQTFLLHFWQGVPQHLSPILECNSVINLIGVCDSILYKTIANVLLPSVLQTLPESLIKMMRQFANELDNWLRMSLFNLPETLRSVKLELSRRFGQVLRRQTSLNHLSQASRMVVNNSEITVQMLRDWRLIDVQNICTEILNDYFSGNSAHTCAHSSTNGGSSAQASGNDMRTNSMIKLITNFCQQFEHLLEEEAQIESYLEWLETLVHKCVLFPSLKNNNPSMIRRYSRHFLLIWSAFCSRVIRDMKLHSAQSFGSFHLLRLMFDDYVLYLVEYVQIDEQMKQFLKLISTNDPPVFTFFYFNDLSTHQTTDPSTVQLEYEPTVSSSTGDFGPTDNQNSCNNGTDLISVGNNGSEQQNEIIVPHNTSYSYHNSGHNSFNSYQSQGPIYGPQVEQRTNNWYSVNGTHFVSYDFDEHNNGLSQQQQQQQQQLCSNSGQLSALINESQQTVDDMSSVVNTYSVDTTSLVTYNSDYERQTH